jgi:hypothetical protein
MCSLLKEAWLQNNMVELMLMRTARVLHATQQQKPRVAW